MLGFFIELRLKEMRAVGVRMDDPLSRPNPPYPLKIEAPAAPLKTAPLGCSFIPHPLLIVAYGTLLFTGGLRIELQLVDSLVEVLVYIFS